MHVYIQHEYQNPSNQIVVHEKQSYINSSNYRPKKAVAEPAASVSPYAAEASVSPVPHQELEPAATYIPPHSHTMSQPQPPGVYGPSEITLPPPPGMEPVTLPSAVAVAEVTQPPPPGTIPPAPESMPPVPMQPETSGYVDVLNGAYSGDNSYEEEEE